MRRFWSLVLILVLLCGFAQAAQPKTGVVQLPNIDSFHNATFELLQGDEALVTLEDGDVVNAVVAQDGPTCRAVQQVIV